MPFYLLACRIRYGVNQRQKRPGQIKARSWDGKEGERLAGSILLDDHVESPPITRVFVALAQVVSTLKVIESITNAILMRQMCSILQGFEREAERYICSYANCLDTVESLIKNVDLAAPKKGRYARRSQSQGRWHSRKTVRGLILNLTSHAALNKKNAQRIRINPTRGSMILVAREPTFRDLTLRKRLFRE